MYHPILHHKSLGVSGQSFFFSSYDVAVQFKLASTMWNPELKEKNNKTKQKASLH